MFPDLYTVARVREEQIVEWLREAERDRLARLALAGRKRGAGPVCRVLAFMGRQMVAWGVRLQERYDVAIEMPRALGGSPQPGGR
jgi:hypothetical protein